MNKKEIIYHKSLKRKAKSITSRINISNSMCKIVTKIHIVHDRQLKVQDPAGIANISIDPVQYIWAWKKRCAVPSEGKIIWRVFRSEMAWCIWTIWNQSRPSPSYRVCMLARQWDLVLWYSSTTSFCRLQEAYHPVYNLYFYSLFLNRFLSFGDWVVCHNNTNKHSYRGSLDLLRSKCCYRKEILDLLLLLFY